MDEITIQGTRENAYIQTSEDSNEEAKTQGSNDNEEGKMDGFQILPGQVCKAESASESSDEFDMEVFRAARIPSTRNFQLPPLEPRNLKKQESVRMAVNRTLTRQNTVTHLQFLGVKFGVSEIKERNKNPTLFLQWLTLCSIAQYFLIFGTFAVGLKFEPIPLACCVCLIISLTMFEVWVCQMPLKNGRKKFSPKILAIIFIIVCMFMALFVYSFMVKVPFKSLPLFLLLGYVMVSLTDFIVALVITPNYTPVDDPDYQLKFFSERIMAGFFNGTGSIDALSDVVLGLQLISYESTKFLAIGICLFILCNIDYIQVARRILNPGKIAIKEQMFTIVVEIIVMILTGIVLFDLSKISTEDQKQDVLMVTVISICTTIINFLHNVFIVYNKIMHKTQVTLIGSASM